MFPTLSWFPIHSWHISLVYGLSYFFLLIVVYLFTKRGVQCDLVENFILFGWFGLLHGIADTSILFTMAPMNAYVNAYIPAWSISFIRVGFEYASYAVLMEFCVKIFIRDDEIRAVLSKYFRLVYMMSALFIVFQLLHNGSEETIRFIAVIFGFPVYLMSGAAFFLFARQSRTVRIKRLHLAFNGIAVCFAAFALLKAVRISANTDTAVEIIRILRTVTAISLASFTATGLSRLKARRKYPEMVGSTKSPLSVTNSTRV